MTLTATPPTIHELQRRIAYLEEVNDVQKKVIQRFYRLLPVENKKFAPGEKLAWAAAVPLIDKEKPNEQGLVRLPIDKVAERIGMSESSASRYLTNICERFDATHEVEPYTTKKGQKCNLTYINPTDLLWTTYPDELPLPEEKERTINGNGKQCPRCHTDNLKITPRRIKYQEIQECECCGYKKITKVLDDNEPLPESEYIPPKLDEIEEAEKGPQAGEPFESDEKAQTSASAYDPVTPPIVAEVFPAAVEVEKNESLSDLPTGKITYGAYPLNGFSLEDWLRWGIGENNQKLIVATGKLEDDKKYISIPHNQLPNIDAYLQGKLTHIYGSAPLNTDDGTTRVLNWDIDDDEPEHHERHETYMAKLGAAGATATYWKRRQLANGQWTAHLKLIFDAPVNAMAAYQWAIGIVPELAEIEECYPIGDRRINRLAWPLWYRIGNIVRECPAEIMFPGDQVPMISTGIEFDRERLTWLLSQAITPAALIPPLPPDEPTDDAAELGGALLDKPLVHRTAGFSDSDVLQQALAWWECGPGHDWEQIADVCNNRFLASWRKERTASVVIDDDRRYACDYGKHRGQWPKKLDRFDAWCLINGLDRRAEKERLCIAYRERQEATV